MSSRPFIYRVARPSLIASLQRWLEIIGLATVGMAAAGLIAMGVAPTARRFGESFVDIPVQLLAVVAAMLYAVLLAPLIRLGALRGGHWRCVLAYPPAWMAGLLGGLGSLALGRHLGGDSTGFSRDELAIPLLVWLGAPLVALFFWSMTSFRRPEREAGTASSTERPTLEAFAADPEGRLIPWLEREMPVKDPDAEDLFEGRELARDLAAHFFGEWAPTVALLGAYGAGKTSIIHFIEHYLEDDPEFLAEMASRRRSQRSGWDAGRRFPARVLLCKTSVWGMIDRSAPAAVLGRAVDRLARAVDCLPVVTLPDRYVQAFKGTGSGWLNLPLALSAAEDQTEQLRRLEPILLALNARLVIVVEDIDRNSNDSEGSVDRKMARELQSMLDRLRDVEGISFILNVSDAEAVDLARLCERIETVRPANGEAISPLVDAFREHCFRSAESKDIRRVMRDESLVNFRPTRDLMAVLFADALAPPPAACIARLLSNPRGLKRSLRQTWWAWQTLAGEVAFDDLLVCTIIKNRSSKAFNFIIDKHQVLASRGLGENEKAELFGAWAERVDDCDDVDRELLWVLLTYCFPHAHGITVDPGRYRSPQGARTAEYWQRIISGRIAGSSIRDQEVLRDILDWRARPVGARLTSRLADDRPYAAAFERLQECDLRGEFALRGDDLLNFTSDFFAQDPYVRDPAGFLGEPTGFLALSRIASTANRPERYVEWLQAEVLKAMPVDLGLALDIEWYWGSARAHARLITLDQAFDLRRSIIAWARENFTPTLLRETLERSKPYALSQFVRRGHIKYGPPFDAGEWSWFTPLLLNTLDAGDPATSVQAALLFNRPSHEAGKPEDWTTDIEYGKPGRLNWDLIRQLIPDDADQTRLLTAISGLAVPPDLADPTTERTLEALKAEAIAARIARTPPPAASSDQARTS